MKSTRSSLVIPAALVVVCASARADIPEGDILIGIESGTVVTGFVSEDGLTYSYGARVFFAELGADVPNATAEPGFQSLPGGLVGAASFSFDFTRALRKWNGTDFSVIPAETFTTEFGPASATSPLTDVLASGLTFVPDVGGAHDHPDWILNAPASDGVYLLSLQFDTPNADPSLPVWVLFSQNADAATNQAAYDFAAATVPAPSVAAALVPCAFLRRRRR